MTKEGQQKVQHSQNNRDYETKVKKNPYRSVEPGKKRHVKVPSLGRTWDQETSKAQAQRPSTEDMSECAKLANEHLKYAVGHGLGNSGGKSADQRQDPESTTGREPFA